MAHELPVGQLSPGSRLSSLVAAPHASLHHGPGPMRHTFHGSLTEDLASVTNEAPIPRGIPCGYPAQAHIHDSVQSQYFPLIHTGSHFEARPPIEYPGPHHGFSHETAHLVYSNHMDNSQGFTVGHTYPTSLLPSRSIPPTLSGLPFRSVFASHPQTVAPRMESAGGPPLYSSIPHNLQSTYQNNNFSLGYPQSFVEHQGKVSPSNDQSNSRGVSSSPTPGLEPGYSEGSDLNIVIEDPKSPNGYREKRMRTKKDAVKQKEESRLLKESGGACLWCYRKKKKCGPIHPCPLCTSTGRRCIRESSQLSLLVPPAHGLPSGETSQNAEGRVFQLATEVLCRLKIKAFQTTDDSRVVVNIRQPNTDLGIWVAEMSQLGITPSNGLNRELVFKLLDHVCSPEMDDIEARFPGHQLIKSASTMARLFAALSSFSKTQVYIRPADVDPGRMTMFYILTTFAQALCEMSNEFCSELTEAMRRKETQDNNPGIIGYSPSPKSPNPVWVAAGLYYRVIKGLLSFKPGPPIANIFDDIKPHLDEVHAHMWSVLRFFPFGQSSNTKASVKEALKNHVPNVSGLRCSDIAFWLDWREEVPPPTALHRQTDPYSGTSYDMESFLNEDFTLPTFLPGSGCDSTGDSQSPPQMSELLSPGDSEAASSSRASIQSLPHELDTLYEDLLDPLGTNGWDSTMAIDAFYRDATWDHGQCDQASTRVGFNPFNDVPLLS